MSVILPCHDDEETLPIAIASLRAQSFGDFDCIVVADGCHVPVGPILDRFADKRFRCVTLERNVGRGAARQAGLNEARGEFVAMLDADDWCYSHRLSLQLDVLSTEPELVAVALHQVVVDQDDEAIGVRKGQAKGLVVEEGDRHVIPSASFGTTLFRGDLLRRTRFHPAFVRGEDKEMMMRMLDGRRYGVLGEIGYVYREIYSPAAMAEARVGFSYQRRLLRRELLAAPVKRGKQYVAATLKSGLYAALHKAGRGRWLFERRNRAITEEELARFMEERQKVRGVLAEVE